MVELKLDFTPSMKQLEDLTKKPWLMRKHDNASSESLILNVVLQRPSRVIKCALYPRTCEPHHVDSVRP